MTKLALAQGKKDLASFREAINNDSKWKPQSEQQIVDDFKKYIDQMQPKLPELFGLLPKSPVTVEPIPDFAKAAAPLLSRARQMENVRAAWLLRFLIRPSAA